MNFYCNNCSYSLASLHIFIDVILLDSVLKRIFTNSINTQTITNNFNISNLVELRIQNLLDYS